MKKEDHVQFNYNKITPHIYLGTNMCCQLHFDKKLLQKGVKLDVSMEGEKVDRPYGIAYYLWLPTRDHTSPSMQKLHMGVHCMHMSIQAKEKVYVHCKNGHGRGPTMVAAYLVRHKGMTAAEAFAYIKKRRPEIHLEKTQMNRLRAWERYCRV